MMQGVRQHHNREANKNRGMMWVLPRPVGFQIGFAAAQDEDPRGHQGVKEVLGEDHLGEEPFVLAGQGEKAGA